MSGYLTSEQVASLLKPINGNRVGEDGKGFSHVQAYDIRAHLTRAFGFGRWSTDVKSLALVFETEQERTKDNRKYTVWTVCYRAAVSVTVCAPDGTELATYVDGATGEAKNQPSRGDAHDLAMKTALSQAFKRAAVNLGDQFGLSLYNGGSTDALVKATFVKGEPVETPAPGEGEQEAAEPEAIDAHIDAPLAPEDEPAPEPRERTTAATPVAAAVPSDDVVKAADVIRDTLESLVTAGEADPKKITGLMAQATKDRCLAVKVDDGSGNTVALKVLLENALRGSRQPLSTAGRAVVATVL